MIRLLSWAPRSPTEHRKLALALGLVSVVVGSGVYWLWRFTRWDPLVGAGVLWLLVGLGILVVGLVCAARAKRRRTLPIVILLASPLLALLYAASADDVISRVGLRIVNECTFPIEDMRLKSDGREVPLGRLDAGGATSAVFRPAGDCSLAFSCTAKGERVQAALIGYVTGGEYVMIRIRPTPVGTAFLLVSSPRIVMPILP